MVWNKSEKNDTQKGTETRNDDDKSTSIKQTYFLKSSFDVTGFCIMCTYTLDNMWRCKIGQELFLFFFLTNIIKTKYRIFTFACTQKEDNFKEFFDKVLNSVAM